MNGGKRLLTGRVNEVVGEMEFSAPPVECGSGLMSGTEAVISLSACERTEKERIILEDAYTLTVRFRLPETAEGELYCYAYAAAVEKALGENPALDGTASRAVITGKHYKPPATPHCGEGWEAELTIKITNNK